MKDFESKKAKALEILATTGIRKSNYLPPATKLLWRLGMNVPPPHFASFGAIALFAGLYFAVAWGAIMLLLRSFIFTSPVSSLSHLALGTVVGGALFGLIMAANYTYGRRKYRLPRWEQLA